MDDEYFDGPEERPRDSKIDEAKAALMADLFGQRPQQVFYGRQIEVLFEKRFFHWITNRALRELVEEGKITAETLPLDKQNPGVTIRFYTSPRKRQANELRKLVREYSRPEFCRALGDHSEMMFDAALPRAGFMPTGKNVREYRGTTWTLTDHDLDRVFERDGIAYGTEIKNTLDYISHKELRVKLDMCRFLGLKPLFIMRAAPKTYIQEVRQQGGFTLIFGWQLYPHGHSVFAKHIHKRLRIPVDSPKAIADGTIRRFLDWHLKQINPPK